MRKLFLHIGTHKTGTTSLQSYLLDHRSELLSKGSSVITERHKKFGEIATCLGFAHGILRNELKTVARMTGDMPTASAAKGYLFRRHVRNWIKKLPESTNAILSAEALCFARSAEEAARIEKVFRGLNFEIVPVVCFRNERDWRASWEAEQAAWSGRMSHEFGVGINDIRGDWYFDPDGIVTFWKRFGQVRRVDYDEAVAQHGSVLPALLSTLELPADSSTNSYRLRQRQG